MSEAVEPQGQAGMAASEEPAEGSPEVDAGGAGTATSTADSEEQAAEGFSSQTAAEG